MFDVAAEHASYSAPFAQTYSLLSGEGAFQQLDDLHGTAPREGNARSSMPVVVDE